jgi:hypothetical protein
LTRGSRRLRAWTASWCPTRFHYGSAALNRDEVNRILDKISAHGMSALTPQERLFLSNFAATDDRPPPVS